MSIVKLIRKRFSDRPIFTIYEIKKYTKNPYQLLNYLLKRREIVRITKGYYTFKKDIMVVGNAYFPYYYGLYEALSLRNLFEQETNPIIITPRKVRTGLRKFLGRNYIVKRIRRKMFFGFETMQYYDFNIYVSDLEKTFIDFIYFKEPLEKNILRTLIRKLNKKKLYNYLKRCNPRLKRKVSSLYEKLK